MKTLFQKDLKSTLTILISLLCLFISSSTTFAAKQKTSFRFVVLGDSRPICGYIPQPYPFKMMLEEINLISPDFVVNVGDLVYGYMCDEKEVRRQYEDYVLTTKSCLPPYYNVLGNHEIAGEKGEELYEEYLGKLYYSFDYGNSHFIVLDTDVNREIGKRGDTGRLGEKQFMWFKNDLEKNKEKENIFVFMHRPMYHYQDKKESSWSDEKERDKVHELLKKYKVKAVFAGHKHVYKKMTIDGVEHYITGGGGAEQDWEEIGGLGIYHYLLVEVNREKVEVKVVIPLHLWAEFYPENTGRHNKVTCNLYCTARYSLPLRIRGVRFVMPKLLDNEEYKISPGARILRIEKNSDNTNTVFVSAFLSLLRTRESITIELVRKEEEK